MPESTVAKGFYFDIRKTGKGTQKSPCPFKFLFDKMIKPSEDFRRMLMAVSAAGLKPVIDSVEPLQNVGKAIVRMERGRQFGKIALRISSVD